jgi:hypothetical protein
MSTTMRTLWSGRGVGVKITPKEKRITSARMTTTVRREERRAERENRWEDGRR